MVIHAAGQLHGERNAPELPIPHSAIRSYAGRFGLSIGFVTLVAAYDQAIRDGVSGQHEQKMEKLKKKA